MRFGHALQSLNLDRLKVAAGKFLILSASSDFIGGLERINDVIGWRYSKNYRTIHKEPAQ